MDIKSIEPVYSDEFVKTLEQVKQTIAHLTGVIAENGRRFGMDELEIRRAVFEDKVIKGIQKHLVTLLQYENPRYFVIENKKPLESHPHE